MTAPAMESGRARRARTAASGLVPFAAVAVVIAYLAGPGSGLAGLGTPLPEITIEQVDFVEGEIRATVRNTGPMAVSVVVADVNDRIQPAAIEPDSRLERFETAIVRIPFPWNEAEPYRIGLTIDDGTRFEREVEAAAPAPEADMELLGTLALIGTYVGIVPVMLGLAWLPFIRRISGPHYAFFLSITVGLLLFLGIDAIEEAVAVSDENLSESFNGLLLIATVTTLSFLALYYTGGRLASAGRGMQRPAAVGLMIAVGIGLHNLGEGLAIGAAIGLGQAALGAFLIVGFALHNTTEGMAIAAPASRGGASVPMLAGLGLLAGAPAILGAWIGGFLYSPLSAVIFLSVGAGAILQVMVVVLRWIRGQDGAGLSGAPVAAGIATGMAVMYLTSIVI